MKDIAKKSNTMYLLDKYQLQASKKFGQNFLIDLNVIKKIVDTTNVDENTCVIEIGPGIGALTEQLAIRAKKVRCYEIDTRLKEVLNESLEDYHNVEIVFQDFLTVDLYQAVEELRKEYDKVCIVANLPYYITSDIIEHVIASNARIDSMHAMVQKEVALKLTDKNTKMPLTFMIESIGDITLDMNVSKNVFSPAPHVDSAIISFRKRNDYDQRLTEVLNASFKQKRKTIYNNLKELFKEDTLEVLDQCKIDQKLRPEQLSINDYYHLMEYIKEE